MDPIKDFYAANENLCNLVIALFVFGGMARIAFWRACDGMKVSWPLVTGLALLLSLSLLSWANENGRSITDLGPWAAFILLEALLLLVLNAHRKSEEM